MKVVAKNITIGMKFKVIKNIELFIGLTINDTKSWGTDSIERFSPQIGQILTISRKFRSGTYYPTVFKIDNSEIEYCSEFNQFKKCSELIDGQEIIETRIFNPTSTGPFNGFDIDIDSFEFDNYWGSLELKFKLIGEAEGVKRGILSTKHINIIKKSPGFREKMIKLIYNILEQNKKDVGKLLGKGHLPFTIITDIAAYTSYNAGKIKIDIKFFHKDIETTKFEICKMVEIFIRSKNTSNNLDDIEIDDLQLMTIYGLANE